MAPARATVPLQHIAPVLTTPWTSTISTTLPLPEYPRPQLQRAAWQNLNGPWQYEAAPYGSAPPFGRALAQTILVPFPVQSPLSGIERGDKAGFYRRTFTVPTTWRNDRLVLNFGAVTWAARVYVNRRLVGTHFGDYDGFSIDITSALARHGENELIVEYGNPTGVAGEPVGKQAPGIPGGLEHTANSGIWQTVWLEPVSPRGHLAAIQLTPDVAHSRLTVTPTTFNAGGLTLRVRALAGRRTVATATGPASRPLRLAIPHARLWSPGHPFLYTLELDLLRGSTAVDHVQSYAGMRSVTVGRVNGQPRILLNGRFVFQDGALDQGYWPDGDYTTADGAMAGDIRAAKSLGFNMLREHMKVQPDRWYYWADRLGLFVWQDMPTMSQLTSHAPTPHAEGEFRRELQQIVEQRRSHPSVVTWIPFNEGWQQFDLSGITQEVRRLDPAALVDTQSGSANCCDALESPLSDIRDTHLYSGPFGASPDRRPVAIGEYGGYLPFAPAADRWPGTQYSIGSPAGNAPVSYSNGMITRQFSMLASDVRHGDVSAAVFTELFACEAELGLIAYDRRVTTVNPALIRGLNDEVRRSAASAAASKPVVPAGTLDFWDLTEGRASATTIPDTGPGAHPLTAIGAPRWTRGVHGHPALILSGAAAGATTTGAVFDTTRSYTVGAWLRSDRAGQSGSAVSQAGSLGSAFSLGLQTDTGRQPQAVPGFIASGHIPPASRSWWTFRTPTSASCVGQRCDISANMHFDDGRLSVHTGSWHYVTGVYDHSTRTVAVFVDGLPQDAEHVDGPPASTGALLLGTGTGLYSTQDLFAGAITQLRTYARALSPEEVWQLYRAAAASNATR